MEDEGLMVPAGRRRPHDQPRDAEFYGRTHGRENSILLCRSHATSHRSAREGSKDHYASRAREKVAKITRWPSVHARARGCAPRSDRLAAAFVFCLAIAARGALARDGHARPAAGPIGDWIESASEKAPTPPGLVAPAASLALRFRKKVFIRWRASGARPNTMDFFLALFFLAIALRRRPMAVGRSRREDSATRTSRRSANSF